jgi:hypothetical protein
MLEFLPTLLTALLYLLGAGVLAIINLLVWAGFVSGCMQIAKQLHAARQRASAQRFAQQAKAYRDEVGQRLADAAEGKTAIGDINQAFKDVRDAFAGLAPKAKKR